jgi:hypothetical protein
MLIIQAIMAAKARFSKVFAIDPVPERMGQLKRHSHNIHVSGDRG